MTKDLPEHPPTVDFLAVENAADARIETARGADGVVSVAGPRLWRGGLRARW